MCPRQIPDISLIATRATAKIQIIPAIGIRPPRELPHARSAARTEAPMGVLIDST